MRKFYLLPILALFFSAFVAGNLEAATYYIDGSKGKDSNPGSLVLPWKTIGKANSTLQADDTVYIREGTYYSDTIAPSKSGTDASHYITYQNYNRESVTISGGSYQVDLKNKNYIKVDGINFYDAKIKWVYFCEANYNMIQNCTFEKCTAYSGIRFIARYKIGDTWYYDVGPSNYNVIKDCTFYDAPINARGDGTSPADFINVLKGKYNIFDGNVFNRVSHAALALYRQGTLGYNIVRNNTFQNKYHTGFGTSTNWTLIENNLFYDQGDDYLNDPSPARNKRHNPGIQLNSQYNIVRNNVFDNNGAGLTMGPDEVNAEYNKVYNNTINNSIRCHYTSFSGTDISWSNNIFKNNMYINAYDYNDEDGYNIYVNAGGTASNNRWYNNNSWGGVNYHLCKGTKGSFQAIISAYPSDLPAGNISVDPKFVDPNNRRFALQSSSPLIDAGAFLTTITSSTGNGIKSFTVDDASYFYDGWTIPGETGDQIKTENGQTTTISKINYDTNTITVSVAIDIINGEGLALNYSGSVPDIGAHEYGSTLASPGRLTAIPD